MSYLFLLSNLCSWKCLQKMSDKCFKKCVTKPGTSLDNSEQVSLQNVDLLFIKHFLNLINIIRNYQYWQLWRMCVKPVTLWYYSCVVKKMCSITVLVTRVKVLGVEITGVVKRGRGARTTGAAVERCNSGMSYGAFGFSAWAFTTLTPIIANILVLTRTNKWQARLHDYSPLLPCLNLYMPFIILVVSVLQKCVAMCMDRYMDTWNLVSRVYAQRLQKEKNRIG